MKIFLDTNVLLSAAHSDGLCRELLYWPSRVLGIANDNYLTHPNGRVHYVSSERVITELSRNLTRKFRNSPANTVNVVREIANLLFLVPASEVTIPCPDETDGWILADAHLAGCEYFVTGDRIVLSIYSVQGMRIISPRELMDFLFTSKAIPKFEAHEERANYLVTRLKSIA